LRRAFFAGFPFKPLSDQSHHTLILNPMLEESLQPLVVDGVETSTNVRVQHPIHFLIFDAHHDRVECLMLIASEAFDAEGHRARNTGETKAKAGTARS
jgi:hypothetical protein